MHSISGIKISIYTAGCTGEYDNIQGTSYFQCCIKGKMGYIYITDVTDEEKVVSILDVAIKERTVGRCLMKM